MTNTLSKSAMLVSLNVRSYGARKEDKKISAEVATTHNVSNDAGKYNKVLIAKRFLEPITKASGALRSFHYENTLPWLDEGVRILPAANFESYKASMLTLQDAYDSAVRDFCRDYQLIIIPDARERLNDIFDQSDYPVDIRGRFGCGLRFMPIPDATDFRVTISDMEREQLQQQIEGTLSEASQAAMRELWERVADAVKAMASRLAAYKTVIVDGKQKTEGKFHDSLVENLRELCTLIPRLNFTNDPKLEAIRVDIERELLATDAQTLRDRDPLRDDVAKAAEKIAADINEFMA